MCIRDRLLPLTRRLEHWLQDLRGQHRLLGTMNNAIESCQRWLVAALQFESLTVRLDRPHHVLQVRLEQLTDAVLQNHRLGRRARQLDFTLERRQQVIPALRPAIQPIERLQRVGIRPVSYTHLDVYKRQACTHQAGLPTC